MKCPRCGCINLNVATHCKKCQVDLAWAKEHPEKAYMSPEEFRLLKQQERERKQRERERLLKEREERGPTVIQRTCSICRKATASDVWEKFFTIGRKRVREFKVYICPACQQRYKQLRNLFILIPSVLLTLLFAAGMPIQEHIESLKANFLVWLVSHLIIFGIVAVVMAYLWFGVLGPRWLYFKATQRERPVK